MNRWSGKVCVVTGASVGIGAAVCVTLADAGLRVVGLARRKQLVQELQASVKGKGSITARQCDMSKADEIADTFKWIEETVGPISVLVNNAGILFNGMITDVADKALSEDQVISTIDVNFKGPILSTRFAVSCMKRHGIDGHIITVNSIAGHYIPLVSLMNVYPATKHAITAFHTTLAGEFGVVNSKIKHTSLSPGLVQTELAVPILQSLSPGLLQTFEGRSPPALQPQDVADSVLYVLSTPPNVNISELTIEPVAELRM